MGFWGPWTHSIGSLHLRTRAVTAIKVAENAIGFGKLTTGLQGSLTAGIGLEYGQTGTLDTYAWSDRQTGVINIPYNIKYGVAYLPDKKALANSKEIDIGTYYLYTIGTSGNVIGSLLFKKVKTVGDIAFATDKNRYWITDSVTNYIHQVGTTTANDLGSFKGPGAGILYGITYAGDRHRIWVANSNGYVYEVGTTLHNAVGSIHVSTGSDLTGVVISPDKNRLWVADQTRAYITEIGTANSRLIGSFKGPPGATQAVQITFSTDKNRLWLELNAFVSALGSFFELGTSYGRAYAGTYVHFSSPYISVPVVIIGQVDNLGDNKGVFTMQPNLGSFWAKAGSYPAQAAWVALGA